MKFNIRGYLLVSFIFAFRITIWNTVFQIITFTDYQEINEEDEIIKRGINLYIKSALLLPFFFKKSIDSIFLKKLILSFGSPIPCPSVTFNLGYLSDFKFSPEFTINLDWDAWLRIALMSGNFSYVNDKILAHRIHSKSETTAGIKSNRRGEEDLKLFQRIWPKAFADILAYAYKLGYIGNIK